MGHRGAGLGAEGCRAGGGSSLWEAGPHSGTSSPHKGSSLSTVAAALSPSALSPRAGERECFVLFLASRWGQPQLTWGLPRSCLVNSSSNPTPRNSSPHSGPHFVDGKAEVQRGSCPGHTDREGESEPAATLFWVMGSTKDYLNNLRA